MIGKRFVAAGIALTIGVGMFLPTTANALSMSSSALNLEHCEFAQYQSFDFYSKTGSPITLSVSGIDLTVTSDCISSVDLSVRNCTTGEQIAKKNTMEHSFSIPLADKMVTNEIYYAVFKFTAEGTSYKQSDIYFRKTDDGKLSFVKSPVYDVNVERCSEMWTDDVSLQECLQPQHDIECDDPFVISESNRITNGCTDDWSKVNAIYSYILSEFAYDEIQTEDRYYVYQDDSPSLLRRKIAICEGMANVFTALCRAQQIPAVVQFGVTERFETFANLSARRDEEWPNHAWAAVCIDHKWYFMDPTFDCNNRYTGNSYSTGQIEKSACTYDNAFLSLEAISMMHKICDADTIHDIEREGSCGDHATYRITRDGTMTISGSGEIVLPTGANTISRVVFDPDSNITSIGRSCFADCDLITQIILPDTVTTIEQQAFYSCEDLEYVYLPEGITTIGKQAFDVCDELSYIYVPDSVHTIQPFAFDDCPRLIISVPYGVRGYDRYDYVDSYRIIVRDL